MTVFEITQEVLKKAIINSLEGLKEKGELEFSEIPEFILERPREKEHGDYSTNCAMLLAKQARMAPRAIAEKIVSAMVTEGTFISGVEVAGAGFINFRLDNSYLYEVLKQIEEMGENYGKVDLGKGEKVMVEFVSANPTGPMHMGNARGGALGDSLAEVLSWAGYDVTREFYINDAGNQIEKFGCSLEARYIQALKGEEAFAFPEDGYHGEDIKKHAADFIELYGDKYLEAESEERKKALVEYALKKNIDALKTDLKKYRIDYDVWFKESKLHESGEARKVVDELTSRGATYEKDGALWFRASEYMKGADAEDAKDEVLVRANGFLTYFAVDIAYHKNKFLTRGFDKVINIWGADHHGHVARLKAAMTALGIDENRLEVILMQLVRLMRGGEVARMSKRTGKAITLNDLIEETGIDAARFFFNMRQANSHFDFDLDLAVEQSNNNPVFYVQYAHARIMSIVRLAQEQGLIIPELSKVNVKLLTDEKELELLKLLARFPEEIKLAAQNEEPSRITRYAIELAGGFHSFYGACKVRGVEEELSLARLTLTKATGVVIKNALTMLSIDAPDKM